MCGIAGILHPHGLPQKEMSHHLTRLRQALSRRGPDGHGTWQNQQATAGLAHTRLAIIDLSSAAAQPMVSADGRYHISFNGEIYNHNELRRQLKADGVEFRSRSDTEVLLALFAREGAGMLARLRGMFAFAIWDALENTCFLARDPLGIKPLYFAATANGFVFASELRAFFACSLVPVDLNGAAIAAFLETGSVPEPMTLLRAVQCLQAGHWLQWKNGRATHTPYWQASFNSPDEVAWQPSTLRLALEESLRAHLVSDVPVGLFLSGGIDSTALAALARAVGQSSISSFSIGVDDKSLDESGAARRTAARFETVHHERRLDAHAARDLFHRYLDAVDQPTIDGFNTFVVSEFARDTGFKVVLSGLGGDELFGGYPSFQTVPAIARAGRLANVIPALARAAGSLIEDRASRPTWRRLGGFLQRPPTLLNAYRAFRGLFSPAEALRIARLYVPSVETSNPPPAPVMALSSTPADAISQLELNLYMRNQLLKDSDVMSMAHGLELRVPFVDRPLVETLARIPARSRLRPGKACLLDAVPEIPDWVRHQPKRGFVFPYQKWLDADWGAEFDSATRRIPFANPTWYQRWAVFMLDHWLARHHL